MCLLSSRSISPEVCCDDYTNAKVTAVKKATTTAAGERMEYPATTNPEVAALLVEIPPGKDTGWHLGELPVRLIVFYLGEEGKPVTVRVQHK